MCRDVRGMYESVCLCKEDRFRFDLLRFPLVCVSLYRRYLKAPINTGILFLKHLNACYLFTQALSSFSSSVKNAVESIIKYDFFFIYFPSSTVSCAIQITVSL